MSRSEHLRLFFNDVHEWLQVKAVLGYRSTGKYANLQSKYVIASHVSQTASGAPSLLRDISRSVRDQSVFKRVVRSILLMMPDVPFVRLLQTFFEIRGLEFQHSLRLIDHLRDCRHIEIHAEI